MATVISRSAEAARGFFRALWVVRAPFLVALLAAVVFVLPDQTLELYRYHVAEWASDSHGLQHLVALASPLVLAGVLFAVARSLTKAEERPSNLLAESGTEAFFLRRLPGIIGAVPLVASAAGLILGFTSTREARALRDVLSELREKQVIPQDPALQTLFEATPKAVSTVVYVSAAVLMVAAIGLVLATGRRRAWDARTVNHAASNRWLWAVSSAVVLLSIALIFLFAAQAPELAYLLPFRVTWVSQTLGTVTIACLFLACMGYFVSMLVRLSDVQGIPIIPLLLGVAVVASLWNLNDNSLIRTIDLKSAPKPGVKAEPYKKGPLAPDRPDLLFAQWLASRPADYRNAAVGGGKKYVTYVVAAEGGGMAAANHVGLVLARLFDRCPDLRHHVFAISGVSGGSIGSAIFAALQRQMAETGSNAPKGCAVDRVPNSAQAIEPRLKAILENDFLAPIIASGLFPGFAQQFLPVPITAFDRARAFEATIENVWDQQQLSGPNIFREPFRAHWHADGGTPMLVLNTTVVETGVQMMIGPFQAGPTRDVLDSQPLRVLYERAFDPMIPRLPPTKDLPLSTAVGLSSRFPFVLPAGVLPQTGRPFWRSRAGSYRLLDGGIFENSAVETALALRELLTDSLPRRDKSGEQPDITAFLDNVEVRVILVGSADWGFSYKGAQMEIRSLRPHYQWENEGGSELLSPLRALYRARVTRGDLAVRRAYKTLALGDTRYNMLDYELFNLPTGFRLSKRAQDLISAQVGKPESCASDNAMLARRQKILDSGVGSEKSRRNFDQSVARAKDVLQLLDTINSNNCSMACVIRDVTADSATARRALPDGTVWCGQRLPIKSAAAQ